VTAGALSFIIWEFAEENNYISVPGQECAGSLAGSAEVTK
jgi:hypothetical protein